MSETTRNKHTLKTWPEYWDAIDRGEKPFEVRQEDDREFNVDDQLLLMKYDPKLEYYDGSWIEADVTYVMRGPAFGLMKGWVIMGITVTGKCIVT